MMDVEMREDEDFEMRDDEDVENRDDDDDEDVENRDDDDDENRDDDDDENRDDDVENRDDDDGARIDEVRPTFNHPVFKKIARINGFVNKKKASRLRKDLALLQLPTDGKKQVLRKRLKTYYREKFLKESNVGIDTPTFRYYVVIDFEATCSGEQDNPSYQTEIIEFPAVVVDSTTLEICNIFHRYVRPVINPELSEYCTKLTGITQHQVDEADVFPTVLEDFQHFLQENEYIESTTMVTDGPYDFGRFLFLQIKWCDLPYPEFARKWVDLKKTFANFYGIRRPRIMDMLAQLQMEFEGRLHSGIDDARNIARILIQLLRDGAYVVKNAKIDLSSFSSNTRKPIRDIVKSIPTRRRARLIQNGQEMNEHQQGGEVNQNGQEMNEHQQGGEVNQNGQEMNEHQQGGEEEFDGDN